MPTVHPGITLCVFYRQWHEIKKEMPLVDFCLPFIGLKSTTWLFLWTMEARISRFNIYITEGKIRLKMEIWTANLKYLLYIHYPILLTYLELAQTYIFIHSFILSVIKGLLIWYLLLAVKNILWINEKMPILKCIQKSPWAVFHCWLGVVLQTKRSPGQLSVKAHD